MKLGDHEPISVTDMRKRTEIARFDGMTWVGAGYSLADMKRDFDAALGEIERLRENVDTWQDASDSEHILAENAEAERDALLLALRSALDMLDYDPSHWTSNKEGRARLADLQALAYPAKETP